MKFELKKRDLGIIILAALLLESISVMQYSYTRSLLKEELEKRMETELAAKTGLILNTLESAEMTLQEHVWDMQAHLDRPDSLFSVTKRLILANRRIVPAVNLVLSGTRRDDLLYRADQSQRIWILRKLLADMNPTEAMNFMLQLMDEYKTNQDLLDNMSKVTPREAKYYDNY